ncbi:MAG: acyl-CoA desaturase [Candidatus Microthrix sp.]|uniref:acyl-CoA desaturase n=1 Tax=Candidatus Neomicrothrix sp. TaxID=2719034 RepID=UPI0025C07AFC|nr:acyl-CoA desaturase [Candidatus Microthrix sp.]MBL0204779.1 acyl-CoA desaturase [Candidatus Microthrix sp.]
MTIATHGRLPDERVQVRSSIPFFLVHLTPLALIFTGISTTAVVLAIGTYTVRMFFITAGYHRYFAHRSYKTGRVFQFILAFGGSMAMQKGPLWWAGNHRPAPPLLDTDRDLHSPIKGFWWSHMGWILSEKSSPTPTEVISDFAKYPEIRFINEKDWIGPLTLAVFCVLVGGWSGLVLGFFVSTVLLWHATFLVNSLAHVMGRRRFVTNDTSRNSAIIAALTMGEGWHNNHHHYMGSTRQGFYWWEIDLTYYVLRALSLVGVVHSVKVPNAKAMENARVRDGAFDVGMFRHHLVKAAGVVAASQENATHLLTDGREVIVDRDSAAREGLESMVDTTMARADEVAKLTRRPESLVASE